MALNGLFLMKLIISAEDISDINCVYSILISPLPRLHRLYMWQHSHIYYAFYYCYIVTPLLSLQWQQQHPSLSSSYLYKAAAALDIVCCAARASHNYFLEHEEITPIEFS